MASCPKCGRRPIRRKLGIRQCRRCGVMADPATTSFIAWANSPEAESTTTRAGDWWRSRQLNQHLPEHELPEEIQP